MMRFCGTMAFIILSAAVSSSALAAEEGPQIMVIESYGNSVRGSVDGFPLLVLRGTQEQRGRAHGYLGAREIVKTADAMATKINLSGSGEGEESKWAKAKRYLEGFKMPERFTVELESMLGGIEEALPDPGDRTLKATGRPIALRDLCMLTCGDVLELARCSQFSAWGDLTPDGSIIIGRNWDYPAIFPFDTYCIFAVDPEEDDLKKTLDAMWFGMIGGGLASLNEDGVYLSGNDGGDEEKGVIENPCPGMLAMRMAAETASRDNPLQPMKEFVDQKTVLTLLYHIVTPPTEPGGAPKAWILEHVPGSGLPFEKRLRTPKKELPQAIFVTNTQMLGKKDSESDCERYESLRRALYSSGKDAPIDLEKAKKMLDDVSVANRTGNSTQYSAVVFPERLEMHIAVSRSPGTSATKEPYTRVQWADIRALAD